MKMTIYQLYGICFLLFAELVLGQVAEIRKCPSFNPSAISNMWKLGSPALICRSHCTTNADCVSTQDICGRKLFINKAYSSEVELALKQGGYSCPNNLEIAGDVKVECQSKKCAPVFNSCELETKKQDAYIAQKIETNCERDQDCSFFLAPDSKCAHRYPARKMANFSKSELDLGFMRDAVTSACGAKNIKECDPSEKPFCVGKQCLMFKEKPPFKNFVNLEGSTYEANFASNTMPIKMPLAVHSKCQVDSDCTELAGVCSQYLVSLNKKYLASFTLELQKVAANIACPAATKIEIRKSRCFKDFCSFVH